MNIKVGDTVKSINGIGGEYSTGIVRHIGRLPESASGDSRSVWSTWEDKFDGILKSNGYGGKLTYMIAEHLVVIKRKNHFEGKSKGQVIMQKLYCTHCEEFQDEVRCNCYSSSYYSFSEASGNYEWDSAGEDGEDGDEYFCIECDRTLEYRDFTPEPVNKWEGQDRKVPQESKVG